MKHLQELLAVFAAAAVVQAQTSEFAIKRFATEGYQTSVDLDNDDATAPTWKIAITTYFNEDEGAQYLRLKHSIDTGTATGIASDDIVEFQVGFTSASSPVLDPVNIMAVDVAKCTMLQNAQDTRFWS